MADTFADFEYGTAGVRGASSPAVSGGLAVSIFSDRAYWRAETAEDAAMAGLRIAQAVALAGLVEASDGVIAQASDLGDIVLVDCPLAGDAERLGLEQLGARASGCGAQLVVSTSMDALDGVFACLDHGDTQILVSPTRTERVISLGRAMPQAGNRVRELSDADRLALLRLTEQVGQIAQKLEQLSDVPVPPSASEREGEADNAFRFDYDSDSESARASEGSDRLVRSARPPLPDPRLVRRIIRQRQLRARYFDGELFADPAWDMLLDLTAARAEHTRVSVTSLCIASGVPPTTALRWIGQMTDAGLLQRSEDDADRRRAFITLTDKAAEATARLFAALGLSANTLV